MVIPSCLAVPVQHRRQEVVHDGCDAYDDSQVDKAVAPVPLVEARHA